MSQQIWSVNLGMGTSVSSKADRIDMIGRRSSLNSLPNGLKHESGSKIWPIDFTCLWALCSQLCLQDPERSSPSFSWSLRWVRKKSRALSFPPYFLAEGHSRAAGTCCALQRWQGAFAGLSCPLCPMQKEQSCRSSPAALCSLCLSAATLSSGLPLPASLSSSFSSYYPAFSYLCPLLKADLFILESLSFLCPGVHLLVSLFHLFPAWHEVFVKAFLTPLNPFG